MQGKVMKRKLPISLVILFMGCFTLSSAYEDEREMLDPELDADFDKWPFEYMKRPYNYMTEYKRTPMYNFGLGKRSLRYGMGLGKRHSQEDGIADDDDYLFAEEWPESDEFVEGEEMQAPEKREKAFSFGLGKRLPSYGFGLGKRMGTYGFGLGKRTDKFTFGLGKRDGVYSFGLGKRASDPGSGLSRFTFGLGKRFDYSDSDGSRGKRESASAAAGPVSPNANVSEKNEIFGRGIEKRSKNIALPPNKFSRRNRKPESDEFVEGDEMQAPEKREKAFSFGLGKRLPSYGFGLGKRMPNYNFGVGKRNYPNDDYLF